MKTKMVVRISVFIIFLIMLYISVTNREMINNWPVGIMVFLAIIYGALVTISMRN